MTITAWDLLKEALLTNGYNGLYCGNNGGEECGCSIDDIPLCGSDFSYCEPAYVFYCYRCENLECDKRTDYNSLYSNCSKSKEFCTPRYKRGERE